MSARGRKTNIPSGPEVLAVRRIPDLLSCPSHQAHQRIHHFLDYLLPPHLVLSHLSLPSFLFCRINLKTVISIYHYWMLKAIAQSTIITSSPPHSQLSPFLISLYIFFFISSLASHPSYLNLSTSPPVRCLLTCIFSLMPN